MLPKYSSVEFEPDSRARSRSGLLVGAPVGYPANSGLTDATARARAAALGTVATRLTPARCSSVSLATKKNSLSFWIGPPIDPPNWLRRRGDLVAPSKKLRASSTLLRKYSNRPPWKALPPDLVTMLIWPPLPVPYSAG